MKQLLILSIALLSLAACKKPTAPEPIPILPPATQEGKYTFGCYINGKPYNTNGTSGGWDGDHAEFGDIVYSSATSLNMFVSKGEPNMKFRISMRYVPGKMQYTIGHDAWEYIAVFSDYSGSTIPTGSNTFLTDSTHQLHLSFSKFTGLQQGCILAGTFYGSMVNSTGDSIVITDGRFDLGYF